MRRKEMTIVIILSVLLIVGNLWAEELRKPFLDKEGRFWVYKDGKTLKGEGLRPIPPYGIPFCPYGWMPKEAADMLGENGVDLESKEQPFEGEMCIGVKLEKWTSPWWLGVGFMSGPDETMKGGPWWGKTKDGWYYDLSNLKEKRFVVHMRGNQGGERVQWKVGFLAGEKYGDSMRFPAVTKWITLKKEWVRYELDLSKHDLSRVCSLCFVLSQAQQTDPDAPVIFYIDSVYFK